MAKKPVRIAAGQLEDGFATTRKDITQEIIVFDQWTWEARDEAKQKTLLYRCREALKDYTTKVLVFVSRKDVCDWLSNKLWSMGVFAEAMHGGRKQEQRLGVIEKFRQSYIRCLVTTDVMGRGIDIPDITHVFCYDMDDIENYVHRIGRTARGPDGSGRAITFFEYDHKYPNQAAELIKVLEESESIVPDELRKIALQAAQGKRVKETGDGSKKRPWDMMQQMSEQMGQMVQMGQPIGPPQDSSWSGDDSWSAGGDSWSVAKKQNTGNDGGVWGSSGGDDSWDTGDSKAQMMMGMMAAMMMMASQGSS